MAPQDLDAHPETGFGEEGTFLQEGIISDHFQGRLVEDKTEVQTSRTAGNSEILVEVLWFIPLLSDRTILKPFKTDKENPPFGLSLRKTWSIR